jgi:hypothetical protein
VQLNLQGKDALGQLACVSPLLHPFAVRSKHPVTVGEETNYYQRISEGVSWTRLVNCKMDVSCIGSSSIMLVLSD